MCVCVSEKIKKSHETLSFRIQFGGLAVPAHYILHICICNMYCILPSVDIAFYTHRRDSRPLFKHIYTVVPKWSWISIEINNLISLTRIKIESVYHRRVCPQTA